MSSVFGERLRTLFAPPQYMALPRTGIDLSTSGVKAVRLIETLHGPILSEYVEVRLPAGAFTDGEIIDHDAVSKALAVAAKSIGISGANIALPESKSYLFETTTFGKDKVEQRTAIEQHLDELVPLPPAETIFDFVEVGRTGDGQSVVAGMGFARRIVEDTLSAFDKANITARALEGETFASSRALLPSDDESTVLIIDVGKTTTKLSVVTRQIPRFATTINIGGHALTLAVQKYFSVTEEEARKVKAERGIVPSDGNEEYLAAMLSTVSAIKEEIARHLNYWQEHATRKGLHEAVTRAILVGGNASVRGFPEYLEGALQIPVTAGDVFTNLASRDTWIPTLDYTESLAYATAIGLALRDGTSSFENEKLTSLLPRKRHAVLTVEYFYRLGTVATSFFIILVLAAAVLLLPTYMFLAGTAQVKEAKLANIHSALVATDQASITARLAALSNDTSALIALSKTLSPSKTIGTILSVPRPGITILSFEYTPAKGDFAPTLILSGVAATRDALRGYQLTLQGAPLVRTADLPVSAYAQDTNIDFSITLTLSP